MAEPLQKARIRAGRRGLDNVVTSVNVMEVPDILNWVRPGQLLVTTMYHLRDDGAAIEALVPRLAEKGLAGLAITPSGFLGDLPQCMLEAADALDFPLIELPPNVSFVDIIQPLASKILNLQAEELLQSERILHQFIELVLNGGSYSDIANIIAQVVECPVSIVDRFRRVLGSGMALGQTTINRDFIRHVSGDDVYLSDAYQPQLVEVIPNSAVVHMRLTGPDSMMVDCITRPVKVSRMVLGEIIVWGPSADPLPLTYMMAIEHGSTVAALKMMVSRAIQEVEQRFRNEILGALLSDQPHARERVMYLSHELSSRLKSPFVVIVVKPDVASGDLLMTEAASEQSNVDSSLYLARRYISRLVPAASFWNYGPRLVIFCPFQPDMTSVVLIAELQKVCDRIANENSPYTISIGISSVTDDVDQFREAFDCANRSLELGCMFQGKVSAVTHYDDLGLFRIVAPNASGIRLQQFCQETIGVLIEYDQGHGTELILTLRVLLEQQQNLAHTARVLNIHYNTLRYRLDRIKELLGDALENPQQRLAIEVALQFFRLVTSTSIR